MSSQTSIEAIRSLETTGALKVLRRTQYSVNLPNIYSLDFAWTGSAATAPLVQPATGGSAPTAPEPVIEPINKKKERAGIEFDGHRAMQDGCRTARA